MSICINTNELSNETIEKINKDLILKIPMNKFSKVSMMKEVCSYYLDDDKIYIPFSYGVKNLDGNEIATGANSADNIKMIISRYQEFGYVVEVEPIFESE
jgi:hypothetical protein